MVTCQPIADSPVIKRLKVIATPLISGGQVSVTRHSLDGLQGTGMQRMSVVFMQPLLGGIVKK
jgi:hypothetical protein